MQLEFENRSYLGYLELSRLGPEAISTYLDLIGERRGERGKEVEAEKVLYVEKEGATSGNW